MSTTDVPRSPVPVVAGIDVATAAVRVVCADARGRVLTQGQAPLPQPVRGAGGHSEQDAGAWWPAAAAALRRATAELPGGGREVVAVAVSATSGTLVLADPNGAPAGPALMYDDRRAADLNAKAQELGARRWRALGLTVGPTAALGKLVGCATLALPGQLVLHTPDLLGLRLTGHPVATDWSHALKTGYDPLAGEWATEVFDAFDVPSRLLPAVQAPGTEVGTVSAAASAETGLPVGCRVRLGMTDGCAGQIATGAVRPGQFVGVLGTTYVLKGVTRELVTDPAGALYSHRHPDGWWLPGGASNTGGEALAAVDPARLPGLDAAADARGPASYLNYPLRREGERFPFVRGDARGFVAGAPQDEADEHRAALEGVAFLERLALERVQALGVEVTGPLHAAGGGSRSALWTRIRATVLGRQLQVAERAETAFGAALLAAAGTLHADLSASAAAMTGPGRVVDPVEGERAALDESYEGFVAQLRARGWLDG
ncbi:FGGY family carbohydrate kinase [Streptomyces sp. H27-C3]|uniref:FGGY-family carbohydrate kinase n=1 Tax=Streptomyces sp. H27-C3 TaxID=3046305 RepID=UPI0024BB8B85|nr:FGGY family carbohydrate kinase [Streptomyces sp. H27-C3]MDJ0460230.1 FGGY family carbohydrate kinase [Streptomyces sp. H27-C3]